MVKKMTAIFIIIFLFPINVYGEDFGYVEVFCIDQEKVVKKVQSNSEIQKLAEGYIQGIEGIYGKFNPIPDSGYAVKIPLYPPVKIENKLTKAFVDVVIIMFPKSGEPFLIIFENENKLVCFTFKGDTNELWRNLKNE